MSIARNLILAALAALILYGCYRIVPSDRESGVYRVNTITGAVSFCTTVLGVAKDGGPGVCSPGIQAHRCFKSIRDHSSESIEPRGRSVGLLVSTHRGEQAPEKRSARR